MITASKQCSYTGISLCRGFITAGGGQLLSLKTRDKAVRVTWQGSAHGSEGTELQFVHDTEAGTQLQNHQSPAGEEQAEVQTLRHNTQPQDP